jgi:hypothetical protein
MSSFLFQAYPVSMVYAGPIFWDQKHTRALMQRYRDFLPSALEELGSFMGLKSFLSTDPLRRENWGKRACALISATNGSAELGEKAMAPILKPSSADVQLDGRHCVGKDETTWSARDATWSMVIAGIVPNFQKAGVLQPRRKAVWEAVHPFNSGGGYVNFMMDDEGEARVKASYCDNFERLVALKQKFDPVNLFRVNQNIRPSADFGSAALHHIPAAISLNNAVLCSAVS